MRSIEQPLERILAIGIMAVMAPRPDRSRVLLDRERQTGIKGHVCLVFGATGVNHGGGWRRIAIAMLGVRRTSICPSARFRRILSPAILAAFHSGSPLSPAQDGEGIENGGRGRITQIRGRKEVRSSFIPQKYRFGAACPTDHSPIPQAYILPLLNPKTKRGRSRGTLMRKTA